MRNMLMQNGIELPVLSYQELASEFNVQPLAAISGSRDQQKSPPSSPSLGPARPETGRESAG
jgi:type III secretion protein V